MNKKLLQFLKGFTDEPLIGDKILASAFIRVNQLKVPNSHYLSKYIISDNDFLYNELKELCSYLAGGITLNSLIELFEGLIPNPSKVVNGAVYTPEIIKEYITTSVLSKSMKLSDDLICDISCGCGAFLYESAKYIKEKTNDSLVSIIRRLYGLDICSDSVRRTKILLNLYAITLDEFDKLETNIFTGNALSFNWKEQKRVADRGGFDFIIGNPPYVRSKNIDEESKKLLLNWSTTKSGNTDLYILFYEIGIQLLNNSGKLGYITPNTFLKSVNGRELRKYLVSIDSYLEISDFGSNRIFRGKNTYSCIVVFSKRKKGGINYRRTSLKDLHLDEGYNLISYDELDHHNGWKLNSKKNMRNIYQIENIGKKIGDLYTIKNGIATISNDLFIFKPTYEDKNYYYRIYKGKEYKIEKAICRRIIKPNIIKNSKDVEEKMEMTIFPYIQEGFVSNLIDENSFIKLYPRTYNFLCEHKDILLSRDKGKGKYSNWYAYGRTQAINDKGKKILFPYMSGRPIFVESTDHDLLVYCGYSIFIEDDFERSVISKILNSKVFWYYIEETSKPYSGNYYATSKNYVKSFNIKDFSKDEKNYLFRETDPERINRFLTKQYGLSL